MSRTEAGPAEQAEEVDVGGDGGKGGAEAQEGFHSPRYSSSTHPCLTFPFLTDNASPGGSPFRDQRNASNPGQTSPQSERPPNLEPSVKSPPTRALYGLSRLLQWPPEQSWPPPLLGKLYLS